jgi:hypothetical protein
VVGQHDPHLVRRTRPPASGTTRLVGTSETLRARDRDGSLHGHDSDWNMDSSAADPQFSDQASG